jgi:hypothetical protein
MRAWTAAAVAWISLVGCGRGMTPNPAAAPQITSTPPATAMVGVPFSYVVRAEGMTPMRFAVVEGPAGLTIHPGAGLVTWTPQSAGPANVVLSVRNLAGADTQSFDLQVVPMTGPVFVSEPPTEAVVGALYSYDPMVVAARTVTWTLPTAPEGMAIDAETGAVRWTPSTTQVGTQSATVRATEIDGGAFADQSFSIEVVDTGGPAVITSVAPERVYRGEVWRYDATAAGAPTIEWSLPPPAEGTPADAVAIVTVPPVGSAVSIEWDTAGVAPGDYSVAVQAENGLGPPDVQDITITVDPRPPVPEIDLVTTPPPASMFVGSGYHYDVELTPESESAGVVWSLVGPTAPPDLPITIDSASGMVDFTASEQNGEREYSFRVRAENVLGEGDQATISVRAVFPPAAPVLTVTPGTVFTLEVGQRFEGASARATGKPSPALSISGTLPDFLSFDPLTGLLSAAAAKPSPGETDIGSYSFDIVATNSEGTDRASIEVNVIAPPSRVDSITPAAGRREADVAVVVRGSGFVEPAAPTIRLELGGYSESLSTTFVDEQTLVATVPADVGRPPGVYDVVVDQGSVTRMPKRFTVTGGPGTSLSGSISVDTTLNPAGNPYLVTTDVRIENGATLTLEPGVVLMFSSDSNLRIDVGAASAGALVADGGQPGQGDQIVLTRYQQAGTTQQSGHYRGLRFGPDNVTSVTVLRNVVVEFAGRNNTDVERGAVEILAGSSPSIAQSIIRESLNYGLYAQWGAGADMLDWFHDNQITANVRAPISIGADDVSTLGTGLELIGNGQDRIFVRGSAVRRPEATWRNHGVPYYLSAGLVVRGGSTLVLAPGTELRFAPDRVFRVSTDTEEATLIASGSPESPIRMLADSGTWNGVFLDSLVRSGTVLRNVRATGLGASSSGGLRIDNPANSGDRVVIVEGCLFESQVPGAVGVFLAARARVLSFQSNAIDVEGLSVNAPLGGFADVLGSSNTYESPLRVRAGSITATDMIWTKPVASDSTTQPIRPTGSLSISGGSLTIRAGSQVEMPLYGLLSLTDSTLRIEGTASEPVALSPRSEVPYWRGIRLRGRGNTGVSEIAHTVIEAAGGDPNLDASPQRAAIVVEANMGVPATPAIHDSFVVDSNGYGITFGDSTHCAEQCNDNTIVGSRFSAVRIFANFVGRFGTGNALGGNDTAGVLGHEGVWVVGDAVDATATWPAVAVPYVIQGDIELRQSSPLDPLAVLTIEPGTEMRFATGRRFRVGAGNDGALDARGTAAAPITFTSIDTDTPAFWRGIDFNQGSDGSVLDQVIISHGGSSAGTGNVNFRSGSIVDVGAVRFSHSANYAAVIDEGSAPMFVGPATQRYYSANGQAYNPGPGDPSYDCVRDVAADVCTQR